MNQDELVSVIMPSFNQADFIKQSVECVFDQSYQNVELVVFDGGSSDGSCTILETLSKRYEGLRWRSEADRGPAHALNKALRASRGTIIGWLNSDDLYAPGAIAAAVEFFTHQTDMIMLYGRGQHIDVQGDPLSPYPTRPPTAGLEAFAKGCFICQPTVFFRRTLSTLLGPLNEDLGTTFDYEYWLRAFSAFPQRIGFIDELMASSRLHDACITMRQRQVVALEGVKLCSEILGRSEPHWLTTYFEEMFKLSPQERGFDDFNAHCLETLSLAAEYLNSVDFERLRRPFT